MTDKTTQPREQAAIDLDKLARRLRDYARHDTQMDKDMLAAACEIDRLRRIAQQVVPASEQNAHDWCKCGDDRKAAAYHGTDGCWLASPPAATTASASDGSIYESVSRRADPVGHAEVMAQLDEVLGRATAPSRDAAPTDELREAAAAVVARWDSPLWRQEVGTSELINRLRAAMSAATKQTEKKS